MKLPAIVALSLALATPTTAHYVHRVVTSVSREYHSYVPGASPKALNYVGKLGTYERRPPRLRVARYLSHPLGTVHVVAHEEGAVAKMQDKVPTGPNELRGYELHLDEETSEGYIRVRDTVPAAVLEGAMKIIGSFGWVPVEDEEGTDESHVFPDGATGVHIWLYRAQPLTIEEGLRAVGVA